MAATGFVTLAEDLTGTFSTTWTQVVASTAAAYVGLFVSLGVPGNGDYYLDLATGAAGSEVLLATNVPFLALYQYSAFAGDPHHQAFFLPIPVAAGVRLAVRVLGTAGSGGTPTVSVAGITGTVASGQGTGTEAYTPAAGGAITLTGSGTVGTPGAWVQLKATTAKAAKGVWVAGATNAAAALRLEFGTGAAGSEAVVLTLVCAQQAGQEVTLRPVYIPLDLAAGVRVAARATVLTGTATDMRVLVTALT